MSNPAELHDDLEVDDLNEHHTDSNYYGLAPGIVGMLMAVGLIWFMFAVADGFA